VAVAFQAASEPVLPARRITRSSRLARTPCPGGKMPPSLAGKDACRHIGGSVRTCARCSS